MRALLCLVLIGWTAARGIASEPSANREPRPAGLSDWPWWRGPDRNGMANPDQNPPLQWSETENVLWRVPIPGRGHGSPIVVGERVFLPAADDTAMQQFLYCFGRQSGKELWQALVHSGTFPEGGNALSSFASSTPACDGSAVFVNFLVDSAVYTTAFDLHGKQLWQTKITDYLLHQGYGSSPAIHKNLVIVSADNKGGGAIVALDRATGKVAWRHGRPAKPNYASPIILHVAGRDQLLLTGCDLVTSLDPSTGKKYWEIDGATTECVTSTVTDGKHIFTTGGFPKSHMSAVLADGSGKVAWENNVRCYVPSLLCKDGYLYATLDAGVVSCRVSATGEEVWKSRLGGTFSSSPVLVGDRIYATNEEGNTFIFKASPDGYEALGRNKLGDNVIATPAICDDRIFMRVAQVTDGNRQEYLYCLADRSR
ncbi:MAG: PQQ-binding-like beta-propeller repeat protein [Planctomycetaceae bacterium]